MAGYIKQINPHVYILESPCHLIHISAEKAAKQLPLTFEDTLINIIYCLYKTSSKPSSKPQQISRIMWQRDINEQTQLFYLPRSACFMLARESRYFHVLNVFLLSSEA